ncbi:hypothetical protein [Hymenobacter rubripertinctus]|uniref:Uncharacterized protein n=1 Tax=Hymenobacter rubripertinctus TaxID=2029981 RepID=A0A418QV55_9BACT|nr:hypothetical protein [Hymenobacter rubripertinctus]RIY09099.1 hypothetical protein D0T11_13075 [Hymenobacter rubripertinctus]
MDQVIFCISAHPAAWCGGWFHSWGGLLAQEYAARYLDHLRGLIISNMGHSAPVYNAYRCGLYADILRDQAAANGGRAPAADG